VIGVKHHLNPYIYLTYSERTAYTQESPSDVPGFDAGTSYLSLEHAVS